MATVGFLPRTDAVLLAWSQKYSTLLSASPVSFGVTSSLASAYASLHSALAACDPAIRTRSAVSTKNQARFNLKANARLLANLVEGTATVTNSQKLALGLTVRHQPSPIPAPSSVPVLNVTSINGWMLKVKIHDSASGAKRGKPAGVKGASIFSFVGPTPPNSMSGWTFEGSTGKTLVNVQFPSTNPAGTRVWITAFWFNGRSQSGQACAPVGADLVGGAVQMAA